MLLNPHLSAWPANQLLCISLLNVCVIIILFLQLWYIIYSQTAHFFFSKEETCALHYWSCLFDMLCCLGECLHRFEHSCFSVFSVSIPPKYAPCTQYNERIVKVCVRPAQRWLCFDRNEVLPVLCSAFSVTRPAVRNAGIWVGLCI